MYLKSLEINGFKSFPDKTVLNFTRGITAVVGPNGSGKSNISDAILWVLGEQSTKALRSAKMDEVIFSGTQLRHEKNSASVTLVLDNSDRTIPMNEDEISVTRRFYRSGESEYRINGTAVRLRDVHELFMDTGLGRDGYAMVGQGRIAAVINQKSDERREIFEEAAGIAKFRYRRTQAQRQLENANENLLRLMDILNELEERVEPLREQSKKASEFIKLSHDKRELEVSLWVDDIKSAQRNTDALKRQRREYLYEYENISQKLAECESDAENIFSKMQKCTADSESLRAQIKEIQEFLSGARERTAVIKNDIAYSERDIERLSAEIDESAKHISDLEKRRKSCSDKLNELLNRRDLILDEIEKIKEEQIGYSEKTSNNKEKAAFLEQEAAAFKNKLSSLKLLSAALDAKIQQLNSQIHSARENSSVRAERMKLFISELDECLQLEKEVAEASGSAKNRIAGLNKKLALKLDEERECRDKSAELEKKKSGLLEKKKILEDMENSLEGYAESVKYILKQSKEKKLGGICSAVSEVVNAKSEHITAIETALGASAQNIITLTDTDAKNAIELLKRNRRGRATFLPLNTIRPSRLKAADDAARLNGVLGTADSLVECDEKYRPAVQFLLCRTVIAENIETALDVGKKFSFAFKTVTLDGQIVNAGGSMTGGSVSGKSGVLSRRGEINAVSGELSSLEPMLHALNEKLCTVKEEKQKINAEIEEQKQSIIKINEDALRADMEKRRITGQIESLKSDEKSLSEQIKAIENEIVKSREQIAAYGDEAEHIEKSLFEANSEIESLYTGMKEQDEKIAELSDKKTDCEMKKIAAQKDCESAERELSAAEKSLSGFMSGSNERQKRAEKLKAECAALVAELKEIEEKSKSFNKRQSDNEKHIAALTQERLMLEGALTKSQKLRNELSDEREKCSARKAVLDEKTLGAV